MKTLKFGSTGEDVKTLQTALNWAGAKLTVDGIFGTDTKSAVMDYQKKNNLDVDGIAGPETWAHLNRLYYTEVGRLVSETLRDVQNLPSFKKLMEVI